MKKKKEYYHDRLTQAYSFIHQSIHQSTNQSNNPYNVSSRGLGFLSHFSLISPTPGGVLIHPTNVHCLLAMLSSVKYCFMLVYKVGIFLCCPYVLTLYWYHK